MTIPRQEHITRETKYTGKLFSVDVVSWKAKNDTTLSREVVRHPGAVLIVPMLNDETVVMIRNRRVAVNETLWEFPAGTAEASENAKVTAEREIIEETGYRAERMDLLGEFYTSPGFTNERMRVFTATNLTHVGQKLEPYEDIEVKTVALAKARRMAASGELRDGKSIAALLLLDLSRSEGRSKEPRAEASRID